MEPRYFQCISDSLATHVRSYASVAEARSDSPVSTVYHLDDATDSQ